MAVSPAINPTVGAASPRGSVLVAAVSVFMANMALLVLQLVAPRQLAPAIGSSLETWTTIIGVFLSGIALGNWIGGKLADATASTRRLALLLGLGGLTSLYMVGMAILMDVYPFYQAIPLWLRIPLLSTLLCLIPSFVFSLITPLAIKIALPDISQAGRIAGLMFAVSTLGCLIGNYLTGFILIAAFNVNTIALGVAGVLFLLSLLLFLTGKSEPIPTPIQSQTQDVMGVKLQSANPTAPLDQAPVRGFLDLRGNLRLAYAIVFIASFCGMTLELSGFRHLAPHLGVSLYTWTGIIGVMLAGTAMGNYLGGILADRGLLPALRFAGAIIFGLIGAAASHSIGRELLNILPLGIQERAGGAGNWIASTFGTDTLRWGVRFFGFLGGIGLVRLGIWLAEAPGGLYVWAATICGLAMPMFAHSIEYHYPDTFEAYQEWNAGVSDSVGFKVEPWITRLIGVLVGLFLVGGARLFQKFWGEERVSGTSLLGGTLVLAGVTTILVIVMTGVFSYSTLYTTGTIRQLPLVDKVLAWTFGLFFLPMFWLGTISPQVIRLSVSNLERAGRTAGSVYAWSTLGAIIGTFATGYLLISTFGVFFVLLGVTLVLMVLGVLIGQLWRSPSMQFVGSMVLGGIVAAMFLGSFHKGMTYDLETNYYAIRVDCYVPEAEKPGQEAIDIVASPAGAWRETVQQLSLDRLIHSTVKLSDPSYLYYTHEHVQVELVRNAMANGKPNVLVIGGGGYTFPRYLEVSFPEKVNVQVVEIDPGVTEIAHRKLGLPRNTNIQSFNLDGRQYVVERAPKANYDLVIQDAVNDLSVPYHLMTKQYNDAVKAILKPDGAYMLTIIDSLEDGKLWRAGFHTMRQTFPHVTLLGPGNPSDPLEDAWTPNRLSGRSVYVIMGTMEEFNPETLEATLLAQGVNTFWTRKLPQDTLDKLLAKMKPIILTDQFAPVDNLMADVFRKRETDRGGGGDE